MTQEPILLLTRPEAAARRFAAQMRAAGLGLRVVIAPLMRIEGVAHDADAVQAVPRLVLTSPHAVPFAGPGAGRTAFCVGPATARAARKAGFRVIEGPGDAARLAPMLAGQHGLVHPHGRHVTAGLPVAGIVVYDQIAQDLPDAGRAVLAGFAPVIWPLFSPRSARLAARAAQGACAPVHAVAISPAAAAPWPDKGVTVAASPDAAGLIAAITVRLRVVAPPRGQ